MISPAELMETLLGPLVPSDVAPAGVVVGPANDAQQQAGVVSIVDAGMPMVERYVRVTWVRSQFRCLAGTLEQADRIARTVQGALNQTGRTLVLQPSSGETYLIHLITVDAGPSMHFDSPETWETLLFAEVMIGTDPVS